MAFFPYENYRFTTQLTPKEIEARLNEQLYRQEYKGTVNADGFKIERIINYRNSFIPVIKGKITKQFSSTEVHVIMRMYVPVIIFMCFWEGIVTVIGTGTLIGFIFSKDHSLPLLIPTGMAIYGYLLATLAFKYESKKTKLMLSELLQEERRGILAS